MKYHHWSFSLNNIEIHLTVTDGHNVGFEDCGTGGRWWSVTYICTFVLTTPLHVAMK